MSRAARLGAFIVATLAILVAGVFIIGSKQYLFSSTYQLKSRFDNVEGLDAGGDVRVGGVHAGTVRQIVLPHKPGDMVTVVMDLSPSTREIIKQDSVVSIETEGLLGNQYLAISFGSAQSPDVRDGDMIASQPPLEMADLLQKASDLLDGSQEAIENATQGDCESEFDQRQDQWRAGNRGSADQRQASLQQPGTDQRRYARHHGAGASRGDRFQGKHGRPEAQLPVARIFQEPRLRRFSELAKNEIERLPQGTPAKEFTYSAKQLFDKQDSAKLKNQKSLNSGGQFLAGNEFGVAVVVVSTGMEGDTQKNLVLTQARAMVVRQYLVENFGFDDSQLKTLGMGKQADAGTDAGWGKVQILVYPAGTEIPPDKQPPAAVSSKAVYHRARSVFGEGSKATAVGGSGLTYA